MLAMYNLSLEGTGRQGYFRWKEDICAFIGRHWNFLLGTRSPSILLSLYLLTCFFLNSSSVFYNTLVTDV